MQVKCSKCSEPITLSDAVQSSKGRLSHSPGMLSTEESALLFA